MKKGRIAIICVALVLLLLGAGYYAVSQINVERLRPIIEKHLQTNIGYPVKITGDIEVAYSIMPSITVEGVQIYNPSWAKRPLAASVDQLRIQIALIPLLKNKLQINEFAIEGGTIIIEYDKNGRSNWQHLLETGISQKQPLTPKELYLGNTQVIRINDKNNDVSRLNIERLAIQLYSTKQTMVVNLIASYDRFPFQLSGTVKSQSNHFNSPYQLDLTLSSDNLDANVTGTYDHNSHTQNYWVLASGLSTEDLSPIFRADIPDLGPFQVGMIMQQGPDLWTFKDIQANLMKGKLRGNITLNNSKEDTQHKIKMSGHGLDLPEVFKRLHISGNYHSGKLAFNTDLTSKGNNWDDFLESLNGHAMVNFTKTHYVSQGFASYTGDFIRMLSGKHNDEVYINCLLVQVLINDGIVKTENMIINTRGETILGKGIINLKNQSIDLIMRPQVRGLSIKPHAIPIRITGPIEAPHVDTTLAGTSIGTGKKILGLASGQRLFESIEATLTDPMQNHSKNNACLKILKSEQLTP